jgi:PHD/YefM family antitoxin component YafN of YafNO toxin-antitoxin module
METAMLKRAQTAEATDVQRRFAYWKRKAQQSPVRVRNHGQDEIVLVSVDEYDRLKRGDREVLGLADFTDDDIAAIKKVRMPKKYNYLNKELKNWRP